MDARLAGKRGRCKKCDHQIKIPAEPPAASIVASGMFQLSGVEQAESPVSSTPRRPQERKKQAPRTPKPKSVKLKLVAEEVSKPADIAQKK